MADQAKDPTLDQRQDFVANDRKVGVQSNPL
jgi:hypothetical protein